MKKLAANDLKASCDISKFEFETTEDLKGIKDVIGQDKAKKAIDFGYKINKEGYNIFMSGDTGVGKKSYALQYLKEKAKEEEVPNDWCYVYNFENNSAPIALKFNPGEGKKFKKDMEKMIKEILKEIPKKFTSEDYDKKKIKIVRKYQLKKEKIMTSLRKKAKDLGFSVKTNDSSIYFMPIIDGETLEEEDYQELEDDVKEEINKKSLKIQVDAEEIINSIKDLEKKQKEEISDLEKETGLGLVENYIKNLIKKYEDVDKIEKYLNSVKEDMIENINVFINNDSPNEETLDILSFASKSDQKDLTRKYEVNLLIDNSELKGAPVVIDSNPTYYKIIGKVEYKNKMGNLTTDFTKIKPGLLHKANGGYLILEIEDILKNKFSWEALKRALKVNEIHIESLRDQYAVIAVSSLKPEEIPLKIKVVLIGNQRLYHLLYEADNDFKKLFKIRADFDNKMEKSDENELKIARFIKSYTKKEGSIPFDKTAVGKVIEYASRMAGSKEKLSTKFNFLVEILSESSTWAELDDKKIVTASYIDKAITEREERANLYENKINESIKNGIYLFDTDGKKTGQINGLAVLDTGDYTFGKPQRITATTYMGKAGVVNIEKKSNLSGNIHDKGINILTGYLGQKYAQEFPLSVSCRIAFEQSYGGVDGDSASSTELYAILSSLAEVPIKQGIAVTGSINQRGEIQPIGGVIYKIEGFYKLCKSRGLNGEQGVIIPKQNIKDLTLKKEIIDAVEDKKFNIYAIDNIEQGIEVLTGKKVGSIKEEGTIHNKVYNKLKKFYESGKNNS